MTSLVEPVCCGRAFPSIYGEGIDDTCKPHWDPLPVLNSPPKKIGGNHAFSEIIELKFGKKLPYIFLYFNAFLQLWLLNYL